jgi:hypothetical protein
MQVMAARLGTELSITLINDDGGWRFGSWAMLNERLAAQPPSDADRARRFETPVYALAYFRARYPQIAD